MDDRQTNNSGAGRFRLTNKEPEVLEQEAQSFLAQGQLEEAFRLFRRAAEVYKADGNFKQAALCLASAGSCWSRKSGESSFHNAAMAYEEAARIAQKADDFQYAGLLYKYAALNHDRDGEFSRYAHCFYLSKESYRRFLTQYFISRRRVSSLQPHTESAGLESVRYFLEWIFLTLSFFVWGHGERPMKTFILAMSIILLAAAAYSSGLLSEAGTVLEPDFLKALYFSIVTFSTVGYGDIVPVGLNKCVAVTEALSSLFIMPLFVVALSRKYLRI